MQKASDKKLFYVFFNWDLNCVELLSDTRYEPEFDYMVLEA